MAKVRSGVGDSPTISENFKIEQNSYFEIHRTPPEEKRRVEKALALAASQEAAILLLTPFTTIPRISFDRIKLGSSAVRQLVVRNPGTKELTVSIERPPAQDKGFALDYLNFRLGGREETTLHVGWTPVKGGGVRDNIVVKFGGFRTQVILIGSCVAPVEKKQYRPPPPRPIKPLGTRNAQKSSAAKDKPGKKDTAPKITIPPNPVVTQNVSPPKRMIDPDSVDGEVASGNRRETFVRERPTPSHDDVVQSTPKVDQSSMGPPSMIPPDRRQTFLPGEIEQPPVDEDKENNPAAQRRQTFKAEELRHGLTAGPSSRRATYVKSPENLSWTPQKPVDPNERKKWSPGKESLGNLSGLRKLNDSYASTVFGDETVDLHGTDHVSFAFDQYCLSPEKNKVSVQNKLESIQETCRASPLIETACELQPLNLSTKKPPRLEKYQPDVSDISLAEYELNASEVDAREASLAVNLSVDWRSDRKRLDEFEDECLDEEGVNDEEDIDKALDEEIERLAAQRATSGCSYDNSANEEAAKSVVSDKRLSSSTVVKPDPVLESSLLPDCTDISLCVPQLDLPAVQIDQPPVQLSAEADQEPQVLNQMQSKLASDGNVKAEKLKVAKTPEIVVSHFSSQDVDSGVLETIQVQENIVCIEKEVVREEVIEEVVEYEYEIKNGVKHCVGERNLGKTVTTQETEKILGTPSRQRKTYEKVVFTDQTSDKEPDDVDNISQLIEEKINSIEAKGSSGVKLSDSELDGMLGMLALSQPQEKQQITSPTILNRDNKPQHLPGLRGSPKVSNQMAACHSSFLHKTVTEASFQPPSPDDPRRCSTGIKDKNKENMDYVEPSPHIKKSLFQQNQETNLGSDFQSVPLSSGGHALPIIPDSAPGGQECRLSSDTYVAADEVPPLSTIQELEENSQTKSLRKDNTTTEASLVTKSQIEAEKRQKDEKIEKKSSVVSSTSTTAKSRTPAKPSRINAKYTTKPIEEVAIDRPEPDCQDVDNLASGLMFVSMSPEKQEKRKSGDLAEVKKDVKKSRYSVASATSRTLPRTSNSAANRRSVASVTRKSAATTLTRPGSQVNQSRSIDSRASKAPLARRSIQPSSTSRLNLNRPRSTAVGMPATRPNPFASRNRYYDERWIEKQEKGFSNWLNFILTPQSLDAGNEVSQGSLDIGKLWAQCSQGSGAPRAPTREVMSMRAYTVNREMNRLRRAACKLWQSRAVATVVERLELEIEKLRIVIRKDRQINKDVGMKQKVLSLILSYNPLWLRIALETVYGEMMVSLHGNSDILGISRFLITRFLSCPDILQEFAHPTVPHSYREGHQDALNKFTLKKFLEIVYLLDLAKESRLIRHNPCLFLPDSKIKSSRDILTTFSKDYLSGEGDIIKHLSYLDYVVTHKQTPLDEFDYAVTSISVDLRCGLRLTKVAELLTGADNLSGQMRVPTVSRLQKVHNTEVALKQLKQSNPTIPANITAKDIVDGHREKTLSLLWSIIFGFQLNEILDEDKLRSEILHLRKSLRLRVRLGDKLAVKGSKFLEELKSRSPATPSPGSLLESYNITLLKEWAQLVAAHYNIEIENWTVSWCDGRGLCYLMHHYQPGLVNAQQICQETTITSMSCSAALDDSLEFSYGNQNVDKEQYNSLLDNEKKNFKLILTKVRELGGVPILINTGDMSNTIPDEKVTATFIGYLAARLLDISSEIKAARTIQLAWRKYYAGLLEERMKVEIAAVKVIQRAVRNFLKKRRYIRYNNAALTIQTSLRGYLARKKLEQLREAKRLAAFQGATLTLQSAWRGYLARKRAAATRISLIKCQATVRTWLQRRRYLKLRQSVVLIQQLFKARRSGHLARRDYLDLKSAAVKVQAIWRGRQVRSQLKRKVSSATTIQTVFRGWRARKRFLELKNAAISIQRRYKANKTGKEARNLYTEQKRKTIIIQSWVRGVMARKTYIKLRTRTILLQSRIRGCLVRSYLEKQRQAAVCLQRRWRARQLCQTAMQHYSQVRRATVKLQSWTRMCREKRRYDLTRKLVTSLQSRARGNTARTEYKKKREAILKIQRRWRATLVAREVRKCYLNQQKSAVAIQSWVRMVQQKNRYLSMQKCVLGMQSRFRGDMARQAHQKRLRSIAVIQTRWRALLKARQTRSEYLIKKQSAVTIQSWARMVLKRRKYLHIRNCILKLQSKHRGDQVREKCELKLNAVSVLQDRLRATLKARQDRKDFLALKQRTIALQSYARSWIQRNRYLQIRNSILAIQNKFRGDQARKSCKTKVEAIVNIQTRWRAQLLARKTRSDYLRTKCSVVKVQSLVRMRSQRKQYLAQREAVISLQCVARGFLLRRCLHRQREAACAIQRQWRAVLLGRKMRDEYQVARASAIVIQSSVRMFLERRRYLKSRDQVIKIQALTRGILARHHLEQQRAAAICIQTIWRSYKIGQQARNDYLYRKSCAIKIQSWARMVLLRNRYLAAVGQVTRVQAQVRGFLVRKQLARQAKAAVKIQRCYRGHVDTKLARCRFLNLRKCAISLQSLARMKAERSRYLQVKKSAQLLQNQTRGRNARSQANVKRQAILNIQKYWRNIQVTRRHKQLFLEKKSAAIQIQSWWKMKSTQRNFLDMKSSSIILQKHVRRHQQQKRFTVILRTHREQVRLENESATKIQHWFRNLKVGRQVRSSFLEQRRQIVLVQTVCRARIARNRFIRARRAVTVLQAHARMLIQRRRYHALREATVRIQTRFRSLMETREARSQFVEKRDAAVKIEAAVRGWSARREYMRKRRSAVVLQSWVRMLLERRRFINTKMAAVRCQTWVRSNNLLKQERNAFLAKKQAAVKIQSYWRMYQHRSSYRSLLHTIVYLQARVRACLQQNRYLHLRSSAILIQRYYRNYMEMKVAKQEFAVKKASAVKIQKSFRGYRCRAKFKKDLADVICCQNQVRKFLARKQLKLLKEERKRLESTVVIQSWIRKVLAVRQLRDLKQQKLETLSAVKVQSAWRRHLHRRRYTQLLAAARSVQVRWRAVLAGRLVRQAYLQQRQAAIRIQSVWRMHMQRREYLASYSSIVTCQSLVRMRLQRMKFNKMKSVAVSVQRKYRSNRLRDEARQNFLAKRNAVIKLQSWIRMIIESRRFTRVQKATVVIQSNVRRYLASKKYTTLKQAAVRMQQRRRAVVVSRRIRRDYENKRRAAVTVQSFWRGSVCRWQYQRIQEATLVLQAHTRGWLARRYVRRKREALEVIQKTLRSYRAMVQKRKEFVQTRNTVLAIQRLSRGYLARINHRKLEEDAAFREQLRQEYLREQEIRRNNASVVIVRALRTYIIKKRIIKRVRATVVIQKFWRGYKARVQLKAKWLELTKKLAEIRERLDVATAAAEPEQRLGARTANAIDYLFHIRDMAQLIHAVKTLDLATRLSEDCCQALSVPDHEKNPLAELLNLVNRCNRSAPHMEVISISLDIFINLSRVPSTLGYVLEVPQLVSSLLQLLVVFRSGGADIFSKVCALLQILGRTDLSSNNKVRTDLLSDVNMKKLQDHKTLQQKRKEQNKMRRSSVALPSHHNVTVNSKQTADQHQHAKKRKGSSSVAMSQPWHHDTRPRYHEDPFTAVSALIHEITKG